MTIMFRYPELEDYVYYVAPLPSLKTVIIGLKGSTFPNMNSLNHKVITYLRGAKFSDEIKQANDYETFIRRQLTTFYRALRC